LPKAPVKASRLKCIYRIFYKNAKKSAKRRTDFDITNSEPIYRQKDTLQIAKVAITVRLTGQSSNENLMIKVIPSHLFMEIVHYFF